MIIVKYRSSGIKMVVRTEVTRAEFWEFYQRKKAKVLEEDPDGKELYINCEWPRMELEIVDETLADGCDLYIARPNTWKVVDGEPA